MYKVEPVDSGRITEFESCTS